MTLKDQTGRLLVRSKAVAFISDKDDFEETLREFKKAANDMSWREDLVFGVVTDRELIRKVH